MVPWYAFVISILKRANATFLDTCVNQGLCEASGDQGSYGVISAHSTREIDSAS